MNNLPAMTEAQRQRLTRFISAAFASMNGDESYRTAEYEDDLETLTKQVFDIALAALTATPVADVVPWGHPNEERTCSINLRDFHLPPGPLFTAPPAPVLKPIVLPKKYVCDKNGCDDDLLPSWQVMISCDEIITAIRTAGYEVKE